MAFGDVIRVNSGIDTDPITLPTAPAAGNSLLLFGFFRSFEGGFPTSVSDDVNSGDYESVFTYGTDSTPNILCYLASDVLASIPTITTAGTAPLRWTLVEVEGALGDSGVGEGYSDGTNAGEVINTPSAVSPSSSVTFGAVRYWRENGGITLDSPWVVESGAAIIQVASRSDGGESTALTGTTTAGVDEVAAGWASFTEASTTPTIRKSSTFDIETTLGTITTATLNGVNVFDHVTGQVGTTVSFAGAATDEITTSGEYDLVLGDGVGTETITVQVNVYGVAPSNNPLQKDGSALASLTGVQLRVTDGANINGTELYYSGTATTDASGNLGNIDLSSTAAADTDPVLLHMRTSAGDSIIASETVGLI